MAEKDSYIHLARPLPVANVPPAQATTSPLSVIINAQALFSILDHSLRRSVDQERVIGTLLGVRSEDGGEVEIRNCFAVGHNESQEQVGCAVFGYAHLIGAQADISGIGRGRYGLS